MSQLRTKKEINCIKEKPEPEACRFQPSSRWVSEKSQADGGYLICFISEGLFVSFISCSFSCPLYTDIHGFAHFDKIFE